MWQQVRRLVWRFTYAFTANNNVRLLTLWAVTIVWFTTHTLLFGIALGPERESGLSEVAQRFNNAYRFNRWATDVELAGFGGVLQGLWGWVADVAQWVSGKVLLVLILASIIYFPVAMRDEVQRAWQAAVRRLRERRGGLTDLPGPVAGGPGGAGAGEKPLTFKKWFLWELLGDFFHEFWQLLAHRAVAGGR